ncbi:MAG: YceI family protein [Saprospiraceae bacterium]|nr:YceI family protein [Saprospiraceae bacterium]
MTTAAVTTKWAIDPTHSEVSFKIKHLVISTVTGYFREFEGSISTEGDDWANAEAEFKAKVDSVDTNQAQRDTHLKSDDFFNAEQFPYLSFKSTQVTKVDEEHYKMLGDLTIRDVTKPMELDVQFLGEAVDPYGQHKAGFEITGVINRKEFNLRWDAVTEAGAVVVSNDVRLSLNVQVVKQA